MVLCGNPKAQHIARRHAFFVHVSKRCTAVAICLRQPAPSRVGTIQGETILHIVMMAGRYILPRLGCAVVALLLLRSSTQAFRLSLSAPESPQQADRKDPGACSTTDLTSNRQVESPPPQPDWDGDDSGRLLGTGTSREKFLRDVVGVGAGVAAGISYEPQPAYALFGETERSRNSTLRVAVAAAAAVGPCGVRSDWFVVREYAFLVPSKKVYLVYNFDGSYDVRSFSNSIFDWTEAKIRYICSI